MYSVQSNLAGEGGVGGREGEKEQGQCLHGQPFFTPAWLCVCVCVCVCVVCTFDQMTLARYLPSFSFRFARQLKCRRTGNFRGKQINFRCKQIYAVFVLVVKQ